MVGCLARTLHLSRSLSASHSRTPLTLTLLKHLSRQDISLSLSKCAFPNLAVAYAMAPSPQEDECPVCHTMLSQITDGSEGKESHVQTCIESHFSARPTNPPSAAIALRIRENGNEGDLCPICYTSYLTEAFDGSDAAREAHFTTCFESQSSSSKIALPPVSPPVYHQAGNNSSNFMPAEAAFPSEKGTASSLGPQPSRNTATPTQPPVSAETPSNGSRSFSIFGFGGGKTKEQKLQEKVAKVEGLLRQRWGPPGSPTSEMIKRYWMATRMDQHWAYLRAQHPKQFKKYLDKGYMEPIPVCTVPEPCYPSNVLV